MKDIDKWLEALTDDEAKAGVMKAHIEATEQTKRTLAASDNYQFVRGMHVVVPAVVFVIVSLVASCTACESIDRTSDTKKQQIQAEHPVPTQAK